MATDLDPLLKRVENDFDDVNDLTQDQVTPGPPCSSIPSDNRTDEEPVQLSECKESFPILRLPRELRDEIYRFCLCAARAVEVPPTWTPCIIPDDGLVMPTTPALLRTNKQIYHEAREILYSENIFRFTRPKHLVHFWNQIGSANRKQVRQIFIQSSIPRKGEVISDPKDPPSTENNGYPSHWGAALALCDFENIVHLSVDTDPRNVWSEIPFGVAKDLQKLIEKVLERVPENEVPRLSLTGYDEKEREKFPRNWKVVVNSLSYGVVLWQWRRQLFIDRGYRLVSRKDLDEEDFSLYSEGIACSAGIAYYE